MPWLTFLWVNPLARSISVGVLAFILFAAVSNWALVHKYNQGVMDERHGWEQKYDRAVAAAATARVALVEAQRQRDAALADLDRQRQAALNHVQTEIANAPDLNAQVAAFNSFADSVQHAATSRRAESWAGYNASVVGGGSGTTGSARFDETMPTHLAPISVFD